MTKDWEAALRQRAYEIWEREGRPHGRDLAHWQLALAELSAEPAPPAARPVRKPRAPKAVAEAAVAAASKIAALPKARARKSVN